MLSHPLSPCKSDEVHEDGLYQIEIFSALELKLIKIS